MIKLMCEKCGKVWFTANTLPNQKCDACGGFLKKHDMYIGEFKKKKNELRKNYIKERIS